MPGTLLIFVIVTGLCVVEIMIVAPLVVTVEVAVGVTADAGEVQDCAATLTVSVVVPDSGTAVVEQGAAGIVFVLVIVVIDIGIVILHPRAGKQVQSL